MAAQLGASTDHLTQAKQNEFASRKKFKWKCMNVRDAGTHPLNSRGWSSVFTCRLLSFLYFCFYGVVVGFFFVFVLNACVVDGGVVETTLTGSNRRRLMRRWYKTEQTRRRQKEVKGRIQRKTIEIIRKQTNKEVVTVHALRWMATTYYLWFNQFLCVWFLQIMTTKRLRAMNHLTFCFFISTR